MIRSFGDDTTKQIFAGVRLKKPSAELQKQTLKRLQYLSAASRVEDLRLPPSNNLEALVGDRKGCWSIRVNNQWRLVFRWDEGAWDVLLDDYH